MSFVRPGLVARRPARRVLDLRVLTCGSLSSAAHTLVNLVGVFDVSPLHELTDNGRHQYCASALRLNGFQCGCALRDGELGELTRARMRWLQVHYSASPLFLLILSSCLSSDCRGG